MAVNQASGGAPVDELDNQAQDALASAPRPALVIVQTIDSDIRCDGTDATHVPEFGASLERALERVSVASPDTRILVVGQLGRPSVDFVRTLVAHDPSVVPSLSGTDDCAFFDPDGNLVKAHFDNLTRIIDGYEAEQARVCATFANCQTDGGVRKNWIDKLKYFSPDWNHLNIQGQAAEAKLIWPVVERVMGL
jgi:hypothetical protein